MLSDVVVHDVIVVVGDIGTKHGESVLLAVVAGGDSQKSCSPEYRPRQQHNNKKRHMVP